MHIFGVRFPRFVDDNPIRRDLTDPSVSHDSCRGRTEQSERIEKAFGAEFLQHSDQHVRQGRESEQAVLPIAEEQENESAGPHNRIEQGEQVGPKDVREAPARSARSDVG